MGKENKEITKAIIESQKIAKDIYRSDKVFRCLLENPEYIDIIKKKYLDDDMLERLLEADPSLFRYIKHPSQRIINVGLSLDGGNICYLKKKVRKSLPPESLIMALNSNPETAMRYIHKDCNSVDVENYLIAQIEEAPNMIQFVNNPSEKLKCLAISKDPKVALYFETLSNGMMDIIDAKYPELRSSLPNYTREIKDVTKE